MATVVRPWKHPQPHIIKFLPQKMAEREGFEPSVEFPLHTLSRRAPSTTRTSLHKFCIVSMFTTLVYFTFVKWFCQSKFQKLIMIRCRYHKQRSFTVQQNGLCRTSNQQSFYNTSTCAWEYRHCYAIFLHYL